MAYNEHGNPKYFASQKKIPATAEQVHEMKGWLNSAQPRLASTFDWIGFTETLAHVLKRETVSVYDHAAANKRWKRLNTQANEISSEMLDE